MPTFEFTSPEGKTYEVEGPEGATQEQAFEMLQTQLGGAQQPQAPAKPTLKQRLIGDDPLKELGIGIGRLPAETANLIDMGLSLFGQAVGVGGDLGMRAVGSMHGFDNRTVGLMGQKFRQELSEPLSNPLQKLAGGIDSLMQKFGHAPYTEKAYEKSQIYQVMRKVGELVQQGGDKAEKATGGLLTSADVDTFTQILTLGLGAKGLEQAQPKLDKLGRVTQDQLPVLPETQRTAEAPKVETAPRAEPALDMELVAKRQEAKDARVKELVDARLSSTGERINTILGIKPQQEKAAAAKTQRADIRKTVAEGSDLADYYTAKAEERARQTEIPQPERGVVEENFPQPKEALPDVPPDAMIADALGNVAKTPKDLAILNEPGTQAAIAAYQAKKNQPGYGVMKGQRGAADYEAHSDMVKFLQDLGFDDPKALAGRMLASVDEAKTTVQNNASGESAASLEAQGRLASEKAAGQTRLLVDRDGTVRPLVGVDAVDQAAKPGQVILQKGVGKDEWTTLSKGADVGGAGEARAKAQAGTVDNTFGARRDKQLLAEEAAETAQLHQDAAALHNYLARQYIGEKPLAFFEKNRTLLQKAQRLEQLGLGISDSQAINNVQSAWDSIRRFTDDPSTAGFEANNLRFLLADEEALLAGLRAYVQEAADYRQGLSKRSKYQKPMAEELDKILYGNVQKGNFGGKERGIAEPEDLAKLAAVASGAAVGSQLTDDPLFGAITGAAFTASGLAAASRSGRATAKSGALATADKLDYVLGLVSTRIKNISEALLHSARTLEHNVQEKTHQRLEALHPFAKELKKVKGPLAEELALALTTNDPVAIHTLLVKANNPALTKAWSAVTNTLHEMGKEGLDTGVIGTLRENYFPRLVKDVDGLLESFGAEVKTKLQKDLAAANSRSLEKTGSPLSDFEQAVIINRGLESLGVQGRRKPGFSKQRQIAEVTKELLPHYAPPMEALHHYVVEGTKAFERARFFGRDLVKVPREGGGYTVDLQTSIGNKLLPELKSGKISFAQFEELRKILQSRFGPGEQNAWGVIQDARNYMNAGLLGNVVAAASQIGDLFFTAAIQGLRPTAEALVMQMTGRTKVNPVDFGLMNHLADEFTSTRKSAKVVNSVLKLGLFTAVDKLGKTTAINASLQKILQQTKTVGGMRALTDKWEPAFGKDFPALVQELRSGKVGEQTRLAIFSELSNMQPVSRLEMPQAYLDHPNGRILYMLKSYQLKQLDVLRNESYNKMKKGDVAGGLQSLTKIGLTFGVAGATTQWIQNWMLGRDAEFESVDIAKNLLRTFGWSEYVLDKARKGDALQTYAGNLTPPYKIFDNLLNATGAFDRSEAQLERDRAKVVGYLPVLGRLYEAHELGGAEKWNEREAKRKEKAQ